VVKPRTPVLLVSLALVLAPAAHAAGDPRTEDCHYVWVSMQTPDVVGEIPRVRYCPDNR
jgi:hypothetical protein